MKKLPILEKPEKHRPCCVSGPRPDILLVYNEADFPDGTIAISSSVTGGSFPELLDEAERPACLILQPLAHSFPLPCCDGVGIPLEEGELPLLLQRYIAVFSPQLMCKYFYDPLSHRVILLDDDETLNAKADLAQSKGIEYLAATPAVIKKLRLPE